jgi:hypothetical protein
MQFDTMSFGILSASVYRPAQGILEHSAPIRQLLRKMELKQRLGDEHIPLFQYQR